jgi:hypothetical protein
MERSMPGRNGGRRWWLVALTVAWVFAPPPVAAQEPPVLSVDDLLAEAAGYDGEQITVEGELVGDYGFRNDGFMWTQLNDDSYARAAIVDGGPRTGSNVGIGIRMPELLASGLDPVGGYRLEGPVIRATGIWRFHDPGRGGESYLDVAAFEVVKPGRRLNEGPDWVVFVVGVVLVSASLTMWIRRRRAEAAAE